tara:strand:- start:921 stop:1157 length:237 start_codon:yes stop_codon:yes gene_type:complete
MTSLIRCPKCEHHPLKTSLNAKIVIGTDDRGRKVRKLMPVGAICFECMHTEVINPYTSENTNVRFADKGEIYKGGLKV